MNVTDRNFQILYSLRKIPNFLHDLTCKSIINCCFNIISVGLYIFASGFGKAYEPKDLLLDGVLAGNRKSASKQAIAVLVKMCSSITDF